MPPFSLFALRPQSAEEGNPCAQRGGHKSCVKCRERDAAAHTQGKVAGVVHRESEGSSRLNDVPHVWLGSRQGQCRETSKGQHGVRLAEPFPEFRASKRRGHFVDP